MFSSIKNIERWEDSLRNVVVSTTGCSVTNEVIWLIICEYEQAKKVHKL
jgi:hypothetical protein